MSQDLPEVLRTKINSLATTDLSSALDSKACVAAILRGSSVDDLEVGFIRRAINPYDRWSGQIAFPGGRWEEADEDDFATTAREVREEIGIVLHRSELLGHLHDIQGRKRGSLLNFFIRPLVFYIDREVDLNLDPLEVADFFWHPIQALKSPSMQREYQWPEGLGQPRYPAIELNGDPPLWGLTYLMTMDLLGRLS